ncbi:hypothetical protein Nepgr_016244 [Nepenthes gracilis]|uniref:Uncharacterized protein n=1 Tax=Nepenthes gracilis TaxID=150966 RepID=A0AAD3SMD2_NEPGR|nr:hypothetical protein Nepgr_016244 [Nepenthes gracilis]
MTSETRKEIRECNGTADERAWRNQSGKNMEMTWKAREPQILVIHSTSGLLKDSCGPFSPDERNLVFRFKTDEACFQWLACRIRSWCYRHGLTPEVHLQC